MTGSLLHRRKGSNAACASEFHAIEPHGAPDRRFSFRVEAALALGAALRERSGANSSGGDPPPLEANAHARLARLPTSGA
jgi:hypothetical protein